MKDQMLAKRVSFCSQNAMQMEDGVLWNRRMNKKEKREGDGGSTYSITPATDLDLTMRI